MRADEVQTAVARCLVDPDYLSRARAGEAGDALGEGTLASLELFRGFISRIKHNGIRRIAPLTLRLLHACGHDIAFFAAMAPSHLEARARGRTALPVLFADFEAALTAWLPQLPPGPAGQMEALLRHEGRMWRVGAKPPSAAMGPGPSLVAGGAVEHYRLDVFALAEQLSADPHGPVPASAERDQFLLYVPRGSGAFVAPIDGFSAFVLSGLDGRRDLGTVCREVADAFGLPGPQPVLDLIDDAVERGFAVWPASASGPG